MTPRRRFILAVTVLSFLTVTGFVVGCDSDDTPTVTAPSGGGGTTPTRSTTAEQQGREGLEETDGGSMIRNKGTAALNVRFNYDEARHYRLNPETSMPSDPANAGSAPTRTACGVPATGRANGQCFTNDGVTAPVPYEAPSEPGGSDPPSEPPSGGGSEPPSDPGGNPSIATPIRRDDLKSGNPCVQISGREIRISCPGKYFVQTLCSTTPLRVWEGRMVDGRTSYTIDSSIILLDNVNGPTAASLSLTCNSGNVIMAACSEDLRGGTVRPYWLSSDPSDWSCAFTTPS